MSSTYNSYFFNDFYAENGGGNYMDRDSWMPFFESVADKIIEMFNPRNFLDAGCAAGYLVEALRNKGVEAYGFDISEYAISNVNENIRSYCIVHSITDPLPDTLPKLYDLVVSIEVLEHLEPEIGKIAISNLCQYTDRIIFTSTPSDIDDMTHVNVQSGEYWAKLFAENMFFRDLIQPMDFICPWAMLFIRQNDVAKVIRDYEIKLRILSSSLQRKKKECQEASYTSKIYFDHGQGFSENNNNVSVQLDRFDFFIEFEVEPSVKSVRFDPVEGKGCIVQYLDVLSNKGELKTINIYGTKLGNYDIFTNTDPQFLIDLNNQMISWIKIKAIIIPFENIAWFGLLSKFDEYKKRDTEYLLTLEAKEAEMESILKTKEAIINDYKDRNGKMQNDIDHYRGHYFAAIGQKEDLTRQLAEISNAFQSISCSTCWKMTKPLRATLDLIKSLMKSYRLTRIFYKGLKCLKENGFRYTLRKTKLKLSSKSRMKEYYNSHILSEGEKEKQRNTVFEKDIKFSILVPLYNTPQNYLIEMIDSVIAQTYHNWELCLADGSDENHEGVRKICEKYSSKDKRILYRKLEKNLGISENTNKCIEMATGDYIALFDHDDLLHPSALYENMKAICEKDADFIYTDEMTFEGDITNVVTMHFKPDFAIDNLRANNYICHFSVFSKSLIELAGMFDKNYDGSQDHDMILRLTEKANNIVHIPKMLYFWRSHPNSVASDINSKTYAIEAGKQAVRAHLKRYNLIAEVDSSVAFPTIYRFKYKTSDEDIISIIIPNCDHVEDLKTCISSIKNLTTYKNYEIIIVENNSVENKTFEFYNLLKAERNTRVLYWDKLFNYSAINNFGAKHANGKYIVFLNNDIKIITPNWLEEMLMYAQREDVGAVGCKLYYGDDTIQHAGIILGLGADRVAGHGHYKCDKSNLGYMGRLFYAQNVSAVTAACMMVRKDVFNQVEGFDDEFQVAYNDVDLCMRIRRLGYLIVFTPYAEAYHYESKSRGLEDMPDKQKRFQGEVLRFHERWEKELQQGDPYYNPNLTLDREDFSIK